MAAGFGDPLYQQDQSLYYNQMMQPMATHINTRYKTQICRHYQINGFCQQAEKCQFAHGTHELRKPSDVREREYNFSLYLQICQSQHLRCHLEAAHSRLYNVNTSKVEDSLITAGFCKYGEKCTFAHGDERPPMMQQPQYQGYYGGQMPQDQYYMQAQGFGAGMQDMMVQPMGAAVAPLEHEIPVQTNPGQKILDIVQLTNPLVQ